MNCTLREQAPNESATLGRARCLVLLAMLFDDAFDVDVVSSFAAAAPLSARASGPSLRRSPLAFRA